MWAARLLLLAAVATAGPVPSSGSDEYEDFEPFTFQRFPTETPATIEPASTATTTTEAPETTTTISIEDINKFLASISQHLESELQSELRNLSIAKIKAFVPDQIIDFVENLSYNDFTHLNLALNAFVKAFRHDELVCLEQLIGHLQEHPEHDPMRLYREGFHAAIEHLIGHVPELSLKVVLLNEWFCYHIGQLKPENKRRYSLIVQTTIIGFKRHMNEADKEIFLAAQKEFTERPRFDEGVAADWIEQFPKLRIFYESKIFSLIKQLSRLQTQPIYGNIY